MFAMFKQLFAAITVLFGAFEKQAKAIDHLSTWAEEAAGAYADEARITRQAAYNKMMKELKVTDKQLALAATAEAVPAK